MRIEIRPYCDGWAWFLIDPQLGIEAVASSRPFLTRHAAAESAQRLMMLGVGEIVDDREPRPAKIPTDKEAGRGHLGH